MVEKIYKQLKDWTLDEAKQYCIDFRENLADTEVCEETSGCILREKGICKKANRWPHLWELFDLSEEEMTLCKMIGAHWLFKMPLGGPIYIWRGEDKPDVRLKVDDKADYNISLTPSPTMNLPSDCFPSLKSCMLVQV